MKLKCILLAIMITAPCFGAATWSGYDETLPADASRWDLAAGYIRTNWEALLDNLTLDDGFVLIGNAAGAIQTLDLTADGAMIVGDGTTDPVAESGATLRTSIGVGTADNPQFATVELGHATDTTLSRLSAGVLQVEGVTVGAGDVTKVGTPVDNEIGVWTGDGTIEGDTNLTWDGTDFIAAGSSGAVVSSDSGVTNGGEFKTYSTTYPGTDTIYGAARFHTRTGDSATQLDMASIEAETGTTGGDVATIDSRLRLNTRLNGSKVLVLYLDENGDGILLNDFTYGGRLGPTAVDTFTDSDATPTVAAANFFRTNTSGVTITDFDDGVDGQRITVISKGAIVYDTTTAQDADHNLDGSSVDLTTASGDTTEWINDGGSTWILLGFVDASVDNSGGA